MSRYTPFNPVDDYNIKVQQAKTFLGFSPTADVAEVRHGHWITEKEALEIDRYDLAYTCSVCGHCDWDCTESEDFNYCPYCGAKMDGERSENGT